MGTRLQQTAPVCSFSRADRGPVASRPACSQRRGGGPPRRCRPPMRRSSPACHRATNLRRRPSKLAPPRRRIRTRSPKIEQDPFSSQTFQRESLAVKSRRDKIGSQLSNSKRAGIGGHERDRPKIDHRRSRCRHGEIPIQSVVGLMMIRTRLYIPFENVCSGPQPGDGYAATTAYRQTHFIDGIFLRLRVRHSAWALSTAASWALPLRRLTSGGSSAAGPAGTIDSHDHLYPGKSGRYACTVVTPVITFKSTCSPDFKSRDNCRCFQPATAAVASGRSIEVKNLPGRQVKIFRKPLASLK